MRLVAITAGEADDDRVAAICAAVPPGALTIQVRAKHLGGRALHALTVRLIAIARPAGASVWVNDHWIARSPQVSDWLVVVEFSALGELTPP